MTVVDRILQRWRESKASPYLRRDARVLDIGCGDGSFFRRFRGRFGAGVGLDPALERDVDEPSYRLIAGWFPDSLKDRAAFDLILLLAVLEHVPTALQPKLAQDVAERLKAGGHLVITVPSPRVDRILHALRALRLIHGIALEQHYEFQVDRTPEIFGAAGLRLVQWRRFQLGLNNVFVFQKP